MPPGEAGGGGNAPPARSRELETALSAALGTLSRRELTVEEMRGWLLERDFSPALADEVITELGELGELDDERFALGFAADKRDLAGWGSARIAGALLNRGLEPNLVERACAEEREAQVERAAEQLACRGYDLGADPQRARALAFLTRRGYEYELAYDAIRLAERALPPAA